MYYSGRGDAGPPQEGPGLQGHRGPRRHKYNNTFKYIV